MGTISWRWKAALLLALAALGGFVGTHVFEHWRVCEDTVANVGPEAVARTCRPLDVLDLTPLLVPVAILLFPDVAELAIPGFISLKRDVAVQAERQERIERSLVQVEQRMSQFQALTINFAPDTGPGLQDREELFKRGGDV